ncbi:uncharacterized protein BCR38DRAFT_481450 [Pseudomassariella vexata]|uniref:Protein kinase domain-containing protein n=1 Tax=Pseudomassariella vexata TaxID=1141098 RepID=A0A1Y2EFF8_9PEZI|nr:uncharacterized protein BCR38DRAFT_481450 [Pseudomassariella vexata]ORY70313.1 hypothetical protein BCR38DRAFT_481450 [Pseudomassariella vexata]
MDEEDLAKVQMKLKAYFSSEPRYHFDGVIGGGANGIAYKITTPNKKLVLKICPLGVDLGDGKPRDDDDDEEASLPEEVASLQSEVQWLQKLRGCAHIVQTLDIPGDPLLRNAPEGVVPHGMGAWTFMEYAENGTLFDMIGKYQNLYAGQVFPNRVLWRFFMCLIRACVEMAYYDSKDGDVRVDPTTVPLEHLGGRPPGNLAHMDIKGSNIVAGALIPGFQTREHDITPILKLIDFGEAQEIDDAYRERNADLIRFDADAQAARHSYIQHWDCHALLATMSVPPPALRKKLSKSDKSKAETSPDYLEGKGNPMQYEQR